MEATQALADQRKADKAANSESRELKKAEQLIEHYELANAFVDIATKSSSPTAWIKQPLPTLKAAYKVLVHDKTKPLPTKVTEYVNALQSVVTAMQRDATVDHHVSEALQVAEDSEQSDSDESDQE